MAIEVICPGCKKRFRVSDQFAGKKGPCPECKTVITIPAKGPEVVIHAPETSGPADSRGRPVLKPIGRTETRLTPVSIGLIVGTAVLALAGALFIRLTFPEPSQARSVALALGAILLAPPLVIGGYSFLRDQELEPYRRMAIITRVAICSAIYVLLWGLYVYIPGTLEIEIDLPVLAFLVPLMGAAGAFAAFATLDLDFGNGVLHYGLYWLVSVLLCFLAGVQLWSTTW